MLKNKNFNQILMIERTYLWFDFILMLQLSTHHPKIDSNDVVD